MTLPMFKKKTCANCGETKTEMYLASTNSFDSPEMFSGPNLEYQATPKHHLNVGVEKCSNCDYCNSDLEKKVDNLEEILNSDVYISQLNDERFPELAIENLCYSIILEFNHDIVGAAWAAFYAAYYCDVHEKYVQSKTCRKKAIGLFNLANSCSMLNFEKDGELPLLLIDLYRRSEQFEEAKSICQLRMKNEKNDLFIRILQFQNRLIERNDIKEHSVEEANTYFEANFIEYGGDEYYDEYDRDYYQDDVLDDILGTNDPTYCGACMESPCMCSDPW